MNEFQKLNFWIAAIAVGASYLFFTSASFAQPAVVKAPEVAKARACLARLAEEGKRANLETDRDGPQILILNPTRKELLPLLVSMASCMDDAFQENAIVTHPATGVRSRVWYVSVDGQYGWCATNSLTNDLESIETLGGHSAKRDWYGVTLSCSIGEKILGFFEP